jgi:hypothetical protein
MGFLTPLFLLGLTALAVPILVHLIQRERKDVIPFPSLMFLRRIPYQSVQRRKIHNWLLLLLRCAAIALIVAAFARPFFMQDPTGLVAAVEGAREVVILLDRSASMGYGDRWDQAREAARGVVAGLGGGDRATLVLFATGEEEALRATSDRSQLQAAIEEATVSAEATRYGPALRYAQSLLSRSAFPRREAVLISDFQRTGWEQREEISLPEGATLTPISVAAPEVSNVSIANADFAREPFSGAERVTVTVLVTNRGFTPVNNLPVTLEIDGHQVQARSLDIAPNASGSVIFDAISVADANMRGVVRAGSDLLAVDNTFFFVLSPSRPVSVLIVEDAASSESSLFLRTALEQGASPVFETAVVPITRLNPAALEGRSAVVLNNVGGVPGPIGELLARFVEQGGGLFVAVGDRTPWSGTGAGLLPGTLGSTVDRGSVVPGTLGYVDYSHPVFEIFKQPHSGDFTAARFYRYRALTPGPADRVLARFDDGAVALAERRVAAGRVITFTSTLDRSWNALPAMPIFVPLTHLTFRYLAQYEDPEAWYTVGRMLDISAPLGQIVREGAVADPESAPRRATGVVVTPSDEQITLGEGGVAALRLEEQGFYSARLQGTGNRRPYAAAVNLDPAESDLTPMDPNEFVTGATVRSVNAAFVGQLLEQPELTPADIEKTQNIWWMLLLVGALALFGEAVLSNRLSRKSATSVVAGHGV